MKKKVSLILVVALMAAVGGTVFGSMYGNHAGFPIAKLKLNGQEVTPPSPAIVVDGTTYVPLRFVANEMGASIGWDQDNETVNIGFTKQVNPQPPYKLKDTVQVGDYKVTANSARVVVSTDNPYIKPKDGNMWVMADVTIQNTSAKNQTISSALMFKVADSDGYTYDATHTSAAKATIDGTLMTGRSVRGEVAFEVPRFPVRPFELIFTSDLFEGQQAVIELQ